MKKYKVYIELIVCYNDEDCDSAKLKLIEFTVDANNKYDAIEIAKGMDDSNCTIWDYSAEEILD